MTQRNRPTPAFTIVELLIVVVIIAILAAITIVAYNGIQQRARAAAVSAALNQVAKKVTQYSIENGTYPATLAAAGITDGAVTYQYTATTASFCVTGTQATTSQYISDTTPTPTSGGCPGHGQGGAGAITNLVTNPSLESNTASWGNYNAGGAMTTSRPNTGGANGSTYFYRLTWTASPTVKGGGCYPYQMAIGQLTEGRSYTFSMWVRSSISQSVTPQIEWQDATPARINPAIYGSPVALSPNAWTRVSVTAVAPANVNRATLPVYANSSGTIWQPGDIFDCDAAMLTEGSTLYNYADGNSANWVWNGTANASTSTGPAL